MGIERHDQFRPRHRSPCAKVDFVAPDHPAQEQVQALASAAGRWPREEVAHPHPRRLAAAVDARQIERQRPARKAVQRIAQIDRLWLEGLEKERLSPPPCVSRAPRRHHQ